MLVDSVKEPPLQQVVSELFRDFKGDEVGGLHAIRGFSFQVWQAVLEALRAHAKPDDYAVVLEWQQDVAVLNSSTDPTEVRFVQLKKNESSMTWKLTSLLAPADVVDASDGAPAPDAPLPAAPGESGEGHQPKRRKGSKKSKPSVLAKLYEHRRRFRDLAKSTLQFASNAPFQVRGVEAGDDVPLHRVTLAELSEPVRAHIEKKLREQLELPDDEQIDLSDFQLLVASLLPSEPHKYVAGEFAEMQMSSDLQLSARATMLAVLVTASYVNLRAGKTRFARTLPELLGRGVTRRDVSEFIAAADERTVSTADHVRAVIERLNLERAPPALCREMRRELTRACVGIADRTGATPMLASQLIAVFQANGEYAQLPQLTDIFERWYADFQKTGTPELRLFKREYLYCVMAMIYEDANSIQHLPPVPLGAQPENAQ